ncbi:MAG: hypothetical protein AAB459_00765 [Patescibacteria group bacterium]
MRPLPEGGVLFETAADAQVLGASHNLIYKHTGFYDQTIRDALQPVYDDPSILTIPLIEAELTRLPIELYGKAKEIGLYVLRFSLLAPDVSAAFLIRVASTIDDYVYKGGSLPVDMVPGFAKIRERRCREFRQTYRRF